jgi:hypothetical protein
MWGVTVAVLALTPWTIETREVLPEGFVLTEVQRLSGHQLALLAQLSADDSTWALFTMELGQTPELLQAFHAKPSFLHPDGATVMVVVGEAPSSVYRLAERGPPRLVGTFDFAVDDLTCTADVGQCVLVTEDEVRAFGRVTRVLQAELAVRGVSLSPSGRVVAIDLPDELGWVVIRSLDPAVEQTIAVFPNRSRRFASPSAAQAPRSESMCPLQALGWLNDWVLGVGPQPLAESECDATAFRVDRRTLTRSPVPVERYPWTVLDCPTGGWQSAAGRLTTTCSDTISRLMAPRRGPGPGEEPPAVLPEAIALSPEAVFIDVQTAMTFTFVRRPLRRSFGLEHPSVVTMTPTGVVVQPIAWPGGVISDSFDDGWHLVRNQPDRLSWASSDRQPLLVHLFQRD